ncbi:MAG: hypothetical protein WB987_13540 [Candidatus Acidiferrales bacterium]
MKTNLPKFSWLIAALLLSFVSPLITHAQAETGAEEYKSTTTSPAAPDPAVKTDFQGHFSLPVDVQCHGHKLAPGQYTLVVKTVGQDKMVTLQREGTDVVLQSRPIAPTSVSNEGHSAVMLRHGPGPKSHTLEAVYVENLKLVLFLDDSGHTRSIDKMFASLKRLPIS